MSNKCIIVLLCFITLFACTDTELEKSLQLAGNNRSELEKVLTHYRNDKLKLKAAKFLIRNMDKHYFYDSEELSSYYCRLDSIFSLTPFNQKLSEKEREVLKKLERPTFRNAKKICDLEYITAAILMDNIEEAFEAWQSPFAKNMSFDDFCEYLLPYKSAHERPILWRSTLRDSLSPYLSYYLDTTCDVNKGLVSHNKTEGTYGELSENEKIFGNMETFTFTTWIKPEENTPGSPIFNFYMEHISCSARVRFTDHARLSHLYPQPEKNCIILPLSSMPVEKWSHLALSYSSGKLKVYINGILSGETYPVPDLPEENNDNPPGTPHSSGKIKDFRIYNRALNIREIYTLAGKDFDTELPVIVEEIAEEIRKLYANHKIIYHSWAYNGCSPHTLFQMKEGTCHDYSVLANYIFRSIGIGTAIENTPIWANRYMGHEWNILFDGQRMRNFSLTAIDRLGTHLEKRPEMKAKIYRQTYAVQKSSLAIKGEDEIIPDYFTNPFLKDVTGETLIAKDITLQLTGAVTSEIEYAYLCTFDNSKWVPVGWGERKGERLKFGNVGKQVLYLPAAYRKGQIEPLADPFILSDKGEIILLKPDTLQKQNLILYRKSVNWHGTWNAEKLVNGRFEVANNPDFSDSRIIHTIEELPHVRYNYVELPGDDMYRYFRFVARPGSFGGDMAEIDVYDNRGKKLTGHIIGYERSWPGMGLKNVFDGNPLTFYRSDEPDPGEAGLDFGEPVSISHFRYLPRNDDNFIKQGEEYELYYWDKHWISLGTQKGTDKQYLEYTNVPSNAVFWLWNITKGKEERIFTYEKNEQIWW